MRARGMRFHIAPFPSYFEKYKNLLYNKYVNKRKIDYDIKKLMLKNFSIRSKIYPNPPHFFIFILYFPKTIPAHTFR